MPLTSPPSSPAPSGDGEALRILLVEDDDDVRAAAADWLRHQGFHVDVASDGNEAVEAIGRSRPDGIVLDLLMPNKNGWEVWDWLQAILPPPIPLVIWTASGLCTGAIGHAPIVAKGTDPSLLLRTLQGAMGLATPA